MAYDNTLMYQIGAFVETGPHRRAPPEERDDYWHLPHGLRWPSKWGELMDMEVEPKDSATAVVDIQVLYGNEISSFVSNC